jgi:ABC-type uncharacterized transport system ATPase component
MADEKRPETFGDGSTREQQDKLIKEHEEINEQLHKAADDQRQFLSGGQEQPAPVQPAQSPAQPEQKAKHQQPAS